jgi:hypothetical protein
MSFSSSEARNCSESRPEERINDNPEIQEKLKIKKIMCNISWSLHTCCDALRRLSTQKIKHGPKNQNRICTSFFEGWLVYVDPVEVPNSKNISCSNSSLFSATQAT